ncbi:MAG: BlaI/MecI/CopY family transcriptional regulator [Oscillospiraceae bacterium]|nr:BlaI/MecI/CopY family transcriptional regulator [Oscillospiraceae bacterium]MBR3610323.1 BlaI/MecI/CopY family transcriptional regulator [Oscillospiraceae bacterium]MBR3953258.1 BlaI/MecI/CopY family transcriptional regulator [Oscillospiraceae bacterium]
MTEKLFSSEIRVMELLWKNGGMTAKEIASALAETIGWSKTTTYTVIKKCVEKGAVIRSEPGFFCKAAVSKEEVQQSEAFDLVDRLFDGSADLLVSALIGSGKVSAEQIRSLRELVGKMEEE